VAAGLLTELEQPGVLLLRRLTPGEPKGVASAMFGHTGMDMLICRGADTSRRSHASSRPTTMKRVRPYGQLLGSDPALLPEASQAGSPSPASPRTKGGCAP
jgi:hypothetical protein